MKRRHLGVLNSWTLFSVYDDQVHCDQWLWGQNKASWASWLQDSPYLSYARNCYLARKSIYMKIMTDTDIQSLTQEEIMEEMLRLHKPPSPDTGLETLQLQLATLQQTRTLAWPLYSPTAGVYCLQYRLCMIRLSSSMKRKCRAKLHLSVKSIQEEIEQLMIYMITPSSSSAEDQTYWLEIALSERNVSSCYSLKGCHHHWQNEIFLWGQTCTAIWVRYTGRWNVQTWFIWMYRYNDAGFGTCATM